MMVKRDQVLSCAGPLVNEPDTERRAYLKTLLEETR